jgi:hypothetical protein
VDYSACLNSSFSYLYAAIGVHSPLDFPELCNITIRYPVNVSRLDLRNLSVSDVHQSLLVGFTIGLSYINFPWYSSTLNYLFFIVRYYSSPVFVYFEVSKAYIYVPTLLLV